MRKNSLIFLGAIQVPGSHSWRRSPTPSSSDQAQKPLPRIPTDSSTCSVMYSNGSAPITSSRPLIVLLGAEHPRAALAFLASAKHFPRGD